MTDLVPPAGEPLPTVMLRQAEPEDEEFLFRVFESTREPEFATMPLDPAQKSRIVEMQYRALTLSRQQTFPNAGREIVIVDGRPAGFCSVDCEAGRLRIIDIALLPAFRNRGIGTTVLRGILSEADACGFPVDLRVERTNPARRLYERLGFTAIADEGAYIAMERPVS